MYHPGNPCILQVLHCWGFSCTITFIPGGASGVLLKSKCPSFYVYADMVGFFWHGLRISNIIVACGISQHHRFIGKWVYLLNKPVMKWSFHVLMSHSAVLTRWICVGNNWYSLSFCLFHFLRLAYASLSNQWTHVLYPLWFRCSTFLACLCF